MIIKTSYSIYHIYLIYTSLIFSLLIKKTLCQKQDNRLSVKRQLIVVTEDLIPDPGPMFPENQPITLGLSKSHANRLESKSKLQGRSLFGNLNSLVSQAFKDNSKSGKKRRSQNIKYMLYSKKWTQDWIYIGRDGSGASPSWKWGLTSTPVKILIHGFTSNILRESANEHIKKHQMFAIGKAYANKYSKYNIIIVDWTDLSTYPLLQYYEAVDSVKYAGEDIANFLVQLEKRGLFSNWGDVHLVGFSLGAHVAGVVGHQVNQLVNKKIGRISAIDPAGPLYDNGKGIPSGKAEERLDSEDATFVDVIHCNMGSFLPVQPTFQSVEQVLSLGTTIKDLGHVDFYPDGGSSLRKCTFLQDKAGCSHSECPKIFIKGIEDDKILCCPCQNWSDYKNKKCECTEKTGGIYFGEKVDKSVQGRYYLKATKHKSFPATTNLFG